MFKNIRSIKNFLLFVIIFILGINLLLDFSFTYDLFGKNSKKFRRSNY